MIGVWYLSVADACAVIDQWVAKGRLFYWSKTPEEVKGALRAAATTAGMINAEVAMNILRSAETMKIPAHANAGMVWIKSQWRAHRVACNPDGTPLKAV